MCTVYGYARVSTQKQRLDRQIDNIKAFCPSAVMVSDKYTGKSIERPNFDKLIKGEKNIKPVMPGDTIIFDSVSRMSRNAEEGIKLYFQLFDKGVHLIFLKERHIDTESYRKALDAAMITTQKSDGSVVGDLVEDILKAINRFMKSKASDDIIKAFEAAEKEVTEKSAATKEGLAQAKLRGVKLGRETGKTYESKKSVQMKDKIVKMSKDFKGSMTDKEVIEVLGIARNSYYKYKRELIQSQA